MGAFYLFLINGVFIGLATLALARVLRLPLRATPDASAHRRRGAVIAAVTVATLVPSAYLAVRLVQDEAFTSAADRFVRVSLEGRDEVTLVSHDVDAGRRQLTLTLIAPTGAAALQAALEKRWADAGPADAKLVTRHPSEPRPDLAGLRRDLQVDVLRGTLSATQAQADRITSLEAQVASLEATLRAPPEDLLQIEREIRAQIPDAARVTVTSNRPTASAADPGRSVVVTIHHSRRWTSAEAARLTGWLKVRLGDTEVLVDHVLAAR